MGTNMLFLCVSFEDFFLFSREITPLFNSYKMIDKRDEI